MTENFLAFQPENRYISHAALHFKDELDTFRGERALSKTQKQAVRVVLQEIKQACVKIGILALLVSLAAISTQAQQKTSIAYRDFPLVLTIQFHSLSLPFKDFVTCFSNIGIGLGTEISLGGNHSWVQQFSFMYYRNKSAGNGAGAYTQCFYRPDVFTHGYAGVKIGVGMMYFFRPGESFQHINDNWTSVGSKGKWMTVIPVGISAGYQSYASPTYLAPFLSYQMLLQVNYNKILPVVPNTNFQIGSGIHF